jgi:L-lactate utilization protein LutC
VGPACKWAFPNLDSLQPSTRLVNVQETYHVQIMSEQDKTMATTGTHNQDMGPEAVNGRSVPSETADIQMADAPSDQPAAVRQFF